MLKNIVNTFANCFKIPELRSRIFFTLIVLGICRLAAIIPLPGLDSSLLKQYFDQHMNHGFAYAYLYPGMNKVLQAAGRVIRTTEDHGVIVLLDERFLYTENQAMFPREWMDYRVVNSAEIRSEIEDFWKKFAK